MSVVGMGERSVVEPSSSSIITGGGLVSVADLVFDLVSGSTTSHSLQQEHKHRHIAPRRAARNGGLMNERIVRIETPLCGLYPSSRRLRFRAVDRLELARFV